jgi:hypothetical protein
MVFINTGIFKKLEKKIVNNDIFTKKMKIPKICGILAAIQFRVIQYFCLPRSLSKCQRKSIFYLYLI